MIGDRHGSYLMNRIPIRARLLSSREAVTATMRAYPGMRLVGGEDTSRYSLVSDNFNDHFYVLHLGQDTITLELFSKMPPAYLMSESLLRLASILRLLADDYEVESRSLLPYFVELLARNDLVGHVANMRRQHTGSGSDITLARRINSLLEENRQLRERQSRLENAHHKAICSLILGRYGSSGSIETVVADNGLDRQEVLDALAHMHMLGYKAFVGGAGRFNLVRT